MSSNVASAPMAITAISEGFRSDGSVEVGDLRDLVIPIPAALACDGYFESPLASSGTRLLVTVNGEDVVELTYDGDGGQRHGTADLSGVLNPGENDFRVRCLVSCHPIDDVADSGLVWLRSEEATIIKKKFATRGSLEPFDLRWTLWLNDGE